MDEFDFSLFPVKSYNFTEKELKENSLTFDDSIPNYDAVIIIQQRILKELENALNSKLILNFDLHKLFENNFHITKSPDNKLFNLSFEAKTGGTYRGHVSVLHYRPGNDLIQNHYTSSNYTEFDNYYKIDTINTNMGTGYLLLGFTRMCSWCFTNYVDFLIFEAGKPEIKFTYSITNRELDDKILYKKETRTIEIEYLTDDWTTDCYCFIKDIPEEKIEPPAATKICKCIFKFEDDSFKLIDENSEIFQENDE